jgi:chromosome segregation ATPase
LRPVRTSLMHYGKDKVVNFFTAVASALRSQVSNCILGDLPQILSETQESVDVHTKKLTELVIAVQLLQENIGKAQQSLNHIDGSVQDQHKSIEEIKAALAGNRGQLDAIKKTVNGIDASFEQKLGDLKQWLTKTEHSFTLLEGQLAEAKTGFAEQFNVINKGLGEIQGNQDKQFKLLLAAIANQAGQPIMNSVRAQSIKVS